METLPYQQMAQSGNDEKIVELVDTDEMVSINVKTRKSKGRNIAAWKKKNTRYLDFIT